MEGFKEKNKSFVSIVVYIQNNSIGQIQDFCGKILSRFAERFENMEAVFVIDGHGVIGLAQIQDILNRLSIHATAEVIQLPYYQGVEAAMCAGDDLAIGDFIFEFDHVTVDYDAEIVDRVFERTKDGFDIVSAGDETMQVSSRFFYRLINHRSPHEVHHETFRVISRRAVNRIKILNKTVPYRKLLYASSGLPSDYISYRSTNGGKGQGKSRDEKRYRWSSGIKYMMIYTKLIERITMILSSVFLLTSIGTGAWALYDYFFGNSVAGGWISLMAVLSFGFFGIFLLVTVIIKYLDLLVEANYKKAAYVVESVEKINRG